ncbi:MAG: hypothetical protein HY817_03050 [Candidatus Abawacabacteria bacterium]|nr:hypothetical protein [Candidatus Abawacabacteria bacterium]
MIVFVSIIAPFLINFLNHETLPPSRESISVFSANAFSILIPSPDTTPAYGKIFAYLNDRISQGVSGKESFVGFPLLLFAIVGFIYRRHTYQTFLGLTTIVFYILSLGPTLKIFSLETFFPLPYALLSYVPVFQAFRTPARFVVISYFCIALLSAEGIKKVSSTLKAHFSTRSAYIVKTLILLWTLIEVYSPIPALPILPVPNFPPLRSGPVLNVPIDINDGYALALQIFHKHPIALGNLARFNLQQIQRAEILNRWLTNSDQKLCENLRKDNYSMIILVSPVEDKKVEFLSTCKIPILESYQSFIWRI